MTNRRRHVGAWIVGSALAPPLLYILSIGPVFAIVDRTHASIPMLRAVYLLYLPIDWLCDYSPTMSHVVTWYIGLWTP
jgi:hypothetical protein